MKLKTIFLFLFVFILQLSLMPKFFYSGDARAIKTSAQYLVKNKELGIPEQDTKSESLRTLFITKGQYFHWNNGKRKYFSRWGVFNTLISAISVIPSDYTLPSIIFYHNIYNALLGALIAVLLFKLSCLYTSSALSLFYTLLVLYSTFLGHYLRGQSYEITQLFFFLSYFYFLILYLRKKRNLPIALSNLGLSSLVLMKGFYFPLYIVTILNLFYNQRKRAYKAILIYFLFGLFSTLLTIYFNLYSFNSWIPPFSASYDPYNTDIISFSYHNILPRLYDYFWGPKASIFLYFPLVLFSLLGFKQFMLKFKNEFLLILWIGSYSLGCLSFFYTIGEWCYGPRYLVFYLPLLSLPCLMTLEQLIQNWNTLTGSLFAIAFATVILYSTNLQINFYSRPFFYSYFLRETLSKFKIKKIEDYFHDMPTSLIIKEFNGYIKNNGPFYPVDEIIESSPKKNRHKLKQYLTRYLLQNGKCNFYIKRWCTYFSPYPD